MMKIIKNILTVSLAIFILTSAISAMAVERVSILPSTARAKAPIGNLFQLKGQSEKYILLDNTDEGYFVMTEKILTTRAFSVDGEPVAFDPENENSIAYWLNKDFLEAGFLPDAIISNLVERDYKTEGGGSKVSFSKDYTSSCKVVLLSQTEWSKYNDKFGYADDTSSAFWALRSARALTGNPLIAATGAPNAGLTVEGKWTSLLGVRVAFFLKKDFFEKVSINVDGTGDNVLSIIRNEAEKESLNQMYNAVEMFALTEDNIAPVAENVTIIGRGIVGEEIKGSYSFESLDGSAENGTKIQWQRSRVGGNIDFLWSTISGADKINYVPTSNDVDYYIRMKVTPMTGAVAGSTFTSSQLSNKIRAVSTPMASNVRIVSEEAVRPGTILDVKYSYSDANNDICTETDYSWEASYDKKNWENLGEGRYFKLTNNEIGKYIRVGVVPKKQTKAANGRETISGSKAYSEPIVVENLPMATDISIRRAADIMVTASKTDAGITLSSILTENGNQETEVLTAECSLNSGSDYTVICEWQSADEQNGEYKVVASNSPVLDYTPGKALWIRVKVYTKNAENIGKAVYSEPLNVGAFNTKAAKGETSLTKQVTAGKNYEIWILSENVRNPYAFSFLLEGGCATSCISDTYLISKINQEDKICFIGTLTENANSNGFYFKAGEITAEKDGVLIISDVLITSNDSSAISQGKVFVVEK